MRHLYIPFNFENCKSKAFDSNNTKELEMNARTRLFKELKDAQKMKADAGIYLMPLEDNIFKWTAVIKASSNDTYYIF